MRLQIPATQTSDGFEKLIALDNVRLRRKTAFLAISRKITAYDAVINGFVCACVVL